jgi:hypothetical protein
MNELMKRMNESIYLSIYLAFQLRFLVVCDASKAAWEFVDSVKNYLLLLIKRSMYVLLLKCVHY